MFALILNGKREFPLYTCRKAAEDLLTLLNQYGDGKGRKGYVLVEVFRLQDIK